MREAKAKLFGQQLAISVAESLAPPTTALIDHIRQQAGSDMRQDIQVNAVATGWVNARQVCQDRGICGDCRSELGMQESRHRNETTQMSSQPAEWRLTSCHFRPYVQP